MYSCEQYLFHCYRSRVPDISLPCMQQEGVRGYGEPMAEENDAWTGQKLAQRQHGGEQNMAFSCLPIPLRPFRVQSRDGTLKFPFN